MTEGNAPVARANNTIRYHTTWLVMSLVVGGLALLMSVRSDNVGVELPLIGQLPELCMTKARLGIDCPGCGLTRSFIALASGDVAAASRFNIGGLLLFGILLYQIPFRLIAIGCLLAGKSLPAHPTWITSATVFAIVGLLIAQWLWKFVA